MVAGEGDAYGAGGGAGWGGGGWMVTLKETVVVAVPSVAEHETSVVVPTAKLELDPGVQLTGRALLVEPVALTE